MGSGTKPWVVFFLVVGLAASGLLVVARMRLAESRIDLDLTPAVEARHSDLSLEVPPPVPAPGAEVRFARAEGDDVVVPKKKPVRRQGRRSRGPLDDPEEWFPYVALALGACGVIGFVRLRVERARR